MRNATTNQHPQHCQPEQFYDDHFMISHSLIHRYNGIWLLCLGLLLLHEQRFAEHFTGCGEGTKPGTGTQIEANLGEFVVACGNYG